MMVRRKECDQSGRIQFLQAQQAVEDRHRSSLVLWLDHQVRGRQGRDLVFVKGFVLLRQDQECLMHTYDLSHSPLSLLEECVAAGEEGRTEQNCLGRSSPVIRRVKESNRVPSPPARIIPQRPGRKLVELSAVPRLRTPIEFRASACRDDSCMLPYRQIRGHSACNLNKGQIN